MKNTVHVTILKIGEVLYDGEARAITSTNEKGTFDILPSHGNFIAIIDQKITIHETSGQKKEFMIDSGIIKNSKDTIEIFLGIKVESQEKHLKKEDLTGHIPT